MFPIKLYPLYPPKSRQILIEQIKQLQDIFGYLNDVALAERLKKLDLVEQSDDVELHRALGYVLGWHHARSETAWLRARTCWEHLDAAHRHLHKKTRRD